MTIIANILLVISALVIVNLNTGRLAGSPPGGDAVVGYAWSTIILNFAFVILMILAYLIIGYKGGFDWVASKRSTRFFIVAVGLLAALITTAVSSVFKHDHGPAAQVLKIFSSFAPILIPVILVLAGFILLNSTIRNAVPIGLYKWPLVIIGVLGVSGTVTSMFGFMRESMLNKAAVIQGRKAFEDKNHQRILAEIDSNDVMKNLVFILVFTGDNQPDDIRHKAVAKVKSNPGWEQELIRLLQTDWAPQPLQFLASNDVDHPNLFLEPVRAGVENQARLIRESIRRCSHPSHFYEGQFMWEVERVLRTVDRFKGKGVDYNPAVKELKAAFDEPSDFEKPKWPAVRAVESWLASNK